MSISSTGSDLLKEIWSDKLEDQTYMDTPLLGLVKKGQWDGSKFHQKVDKGEGAGFSNTFSDALANTTNSVMETFDVSNIEIHGVGKLEHPYVELSKNKRGGVEAALKYEVDRILKGNRNKLSKQLHGGSSGSIGQVASVSGSTLTLKDVEQVVNFEVGMVVDTSTSDGGGAVAGSDITITAVDRSAGTLTGTWTSVLANDYIFQDGDMDAALSGLASYNPLVAPTATSFFGVDRSLDTDRLSGARIPSSTASGLPIEEKLQLLASRMSRNGGQPSHCVLSPERFRELSVSVGAKVIYQDVSAKLGFNTFSVILGGGDVKVIQDRHANNSVARMLNVDSLLLASTNGGDPALRESGDGGVMNMEASNHFLFHSFWYGNLICSKPIDLGVCSLA